MKKQSLFLIISVSLLMACMSMKSVAPKAFDMTNSDWRYVDADATYEMHFLKKGKLILTHSTDKTVGNDTWKQKGETVKFYYNKKYASYTGKLYGQDSIIGIGKNSTDSWDFKMYRILPFRANGTAKK